MSPAALAAPPLFAEHGAFAALGPRFFTELAPAPLPDPYWIGRSAALARELGLDPDWLASDEALQWFSGNALPPGARPLASVYSGHQFGVWAGQLGDGRALLLGETPGGLEVQLKGSGRTPYSRMADGRAVLRSSIREFLVSEAMHGLGIPTTRALCVVGSDLPVRRETMETAAVVTRVAPSFIRFGHFEHFSYSGQHAELKALADHVIERFYPDCRAAADPYAALLARVTERTARLIAHWQAVGFMHGVMNTDNMSILGLTIDYGPFQFMDGFDPGHICNHSDSGGRYAYDQQPAVAHWNLCALGQALLPLIGDQDRAIAAIEPFANFYSDALAARMAAKLGFARATPAIGTLVDALLVLLARERTDWSIFWRRLARQMAGAAGDPVRDLFIERAAGDAWLLQYQELVAHDPAAHSPDLMLKSNPAIVLRNHLAEQAIARAKLKDFGLLQDLLGALERPFDEHPAHPDWAGFPPDWASQIQISCSS
ncbi:YdiU family protein [Ottowia pentelensis]|uniref:Protein nucleotidyltransferase YdiU n=1 Tax=Ottowia pentelensis TaxID=511108 RepID=A0ABV6PVL1_9BURK